MVCMVVGREGSSGKVLNNLSRRLFEDSSRYVRKATGVLCLAVEELWLSEVSINDHLKATCEKYSC